MIVSETKYPKSLKKLVCGLQCSNQSIEELMCLCEMSRKREIVGEGNIAQKRD